MHAQAFCVVGHCSLLNRQREPQSIILQSRRQSSRRNYTLIRGDIIMAKEKTLQDLFEDELRDAYDAEKQIVKALPDVIDAVTDRELKEGLALHLEETHQHVTRLEQIFSMLDLPAKTKTCDGMKGILKEGSSTLDDLDEGAVADAAAIAGAQRVEHYEITAYGTLIAWAKLLGHTQAAALLEKTLDEEKAANQKLTKVSTSVNQAAKTIQFAGAER
jgi:ferritin-like metal-binding protein YciE